MRAFLSTLWQILPKMLFLFGSCVGFLFEWWIALNICLCLIVGLVLAYMRWNRMRKSIPRVTAKASLCEKVSEALPAA